MPICLGTKDPEEIIRTVQLLEPAFGGINLEDIAQPKCFHILDALRATLRIPVWHDDQQGSATVILAALINAAKLLGKLLKRLKLALIGMGAANVATYRLLRAYGIDTGGIVACDSKGTLHPGRADIEARQGAFADKWRVCTESNAGRITAASRRRCGGPMPASPSPLPASSRPPRSAGMAKDAILLACANPVPEIWPWEAKAAGARIIGTGRSDFPNQINNSLCFPGIFRGVLDVRARSISDGMAIAAAEALAAWAGDVLAEDRLLPTMEQWEVAADVAAATAAAAAAEGLAQAPRSLEEERAAARAMIANARRATELLMEGCAIAPVPAAAS